MIFSPRVNVACVFLSRSDESFANAASSRYCARSSLSWPRDGFHRLGLRRRTDARDRDADVDRGPDALEEQRRRQVDLPVRNRNEVRRNIRRDVARLRFDDGQCRDGAAAFFIGELRRTLEQARVQEEDVAGVRFAAGRTAQEQRNFAIRDRVFRQIVVDDEDVFARVHEVFGHRAARVGRDVFERRRVGGARLHDRRVFERTFHLEARCECRDVRVLLTDRDVDAEDVAAFLIDDRIDRDGRLPDLAVADDQLALALADRNERVDRADAGLQRLFDGLPLG